MWTDKDDQEIKYGEWYEYDAKNALAEANKVKSAPQLEEIWPNWRDGVPTKFYKRVSSQAFFRGGNFHREVYYYVSLQLRWNTPQSLTDLKKSKYLFPDTHSSEWSGVYRIFSTNAVIDRYCGRDETGTLYIGKAGTGIRKASTLRTRVREIADGRHQAFNFFSLQRDSPSPDLHATDLCLLVDSSARRLCGYGAPVSAHLHPSIGRCNRDK